MDMKPKAVLREFKLQIDLRYHGHDVQRVIDCIENDTLHVFDPCDSDALIPERDAKGDLLINARASLPISIREWLPVGCQYIGQDDICRPFGGLDGRKDEVINLAKYFDNIQEAIFPIFTAQAPRGPGAFVGEIIFEEHFLNSIGDREGGALCFCLAHELVHAFDAMRFLVPACMDWKSFWGKALREGDFNEAAMAMLEEKSKLLDKYGHEHEMEMIAEFWPSHVNHWYKEFEKWEKRISGDQ